MYGPVKPEGSGKVGFMRARCKRYSCPRCGPRKLRQARSRIAEIATELGLTRFVTLTLDPKKLTGVQGAERGEKTAVSIPYLRKTWAKMRVLLGRRYGKKLKFVAVLELHRSGIVHLHVLVGRYIPQPWIKAAWQSVGGGEIVFIEQVDVHRVSAYLSKYLSKMQALPDGVRRFSHSNGLALWEKQKTPSGWEWKNDSIEFQRQWQELDHDIEGERYEEDVGGGRVLEFFVVVPACSDRLLPVGYAVA